MCSVTEACAECQRRFTKKIGNQIMVPLPKLRMQSSLTAFEKVGVDYGGPFLTKEGRSGTRAKRYLCLFTCLATRAVHLEMSYSLDTDYKERKESNQSCSWRQGRYRQKASLSYLCCGTIVEFLTNNLCKFRSR